MNVDEQLIQALRIAKTKLLRSRNRPIFLFLCGGDDRDSRYVARGLVEQYLRLNPCGNNVICVKPEFILSKHREEFASLDLLVLEKLIAEVSDAILLFDESPGSLCELGAFAACDPISEILTAFIPMRYKGVECFVLDGPARHLESLSSRLSGVIYGDVSCPMMSTELIVYLESLRSKTKAGKDVNNNKGRVQIGSYCHELLDLISVFSPIAVKDLERVYLQFKQFDEEMTFDSAKLGDSVSEITTEMLICFLASADLVRYKDGIVSISSPASSYFMFNQSYRRRIMAIRARYLVSLRKGRRRCTSVRP